MSQTPEKGSVEYINPKDMHSNPAYTQVVAVTAPVKTLYIGTQNAVDASGAIVGKGDIAAQTEQTLKNVQSCLEACGAGPEHLVLVTVYVAQSQNMQPGFQVFQRWWGNRSNPPANSVIFVPTLFPTDFLVGIEAIAIVPL